MALSQEVRAIALSLCEGLSCPRSLTVAILIRAEEWSQLARLECDPLLYADAESLWAARSATGFLQKCVDLEVDVDPEETTLEKFWESEASCYRTNERLAPLIYGHREDGTYDEALWDFVSDVQKVMRDYLGSLPPSNWEGRHGPGATMSDKSVSCTAPDKMSSTPTVTPNAWSFLVPWTGTEWAKACAALGNGIDCIRGNSYFSVRKTALVKRGCAKEPSINGFYQLGLGSEMKKRLGRSGYDLIWGQDVHRQIACISSLSRRSATIDLRSASDCQAYNLVKLLVPPRWFEVLDDLRSPFTRVPSPSLGKTSWKRLEKFSSMGNGYTFELETAIFAAICEVACRFQAKPGVDLFAFGDDLIVPDEFYGDVVAALRFFGFEVNSKKSFSRSSFKESCGGDYFMGVGVRPYHLEECPHEPQQYISLVNGIRRLAEQAGAPPSRWDRVRRAWHLASSFIPSGIRRMRGPKELGDLVIHDSEDKWRIRWRSSGVRFVGVYRPARYRKVRWEGFAYDVQFAAALYGVTTDRSANPATAFGPEWIQSRDSVIGYKVGWVAFSGATSQWLPLRSPLGTGKY